MFRFLFPLLFLSSLVVVTAQTTQITITDRQQVADVRRFGINIGSRNRWGDPQFLKNLLDNPGFEPGVFGSVVLADSGSTATTFRQAFWNTGWNNQNTGQPEGFWDGAEYEIVWGAARGRKGRVRSFRYENGAYVFDLDGSGPAPGTLDVMFVRRPVPGIAGNISLVDTTTTRPGSPGRQSMRLTNDGARYDFYMDSYWRDGDRSATKFLPVRGNWHAEVWAKGKKDGDLLRMRFFREGETTFIDTQATLTTEWRKVSVDVSVPEDADAIGGYASDAYRPILDFRLEAANFSGEIWVDDAALYSIDDVNPTVFTDAFVDRMRALRPGILRDWSTQLGATLDAQLAEPFARPTNGSRPDSHSPGSYGYSLPEFLELAREVGAEPWYVMPPTLSPEDLLGLVEYLAAPADGAHPYADRRAALGQKAPWTEVFGRIHLELGNEMWGSGRSDDPFFGASMNGGVRLGAISSDRFAILRSSPYFDPASFDLIIGGQAGYAGRQREIEQNATEHDAIALAPYFGVLDTYASDNEIFRPLLAMPTFQTGENGEVRKSRGFIDAEKKGTGMAIYEINFHTTGGNAPIDVRNDFVTAAAGAFALPLAMLHYQRDLGIVNQCAFSSLGFSFRMGNGDYVRIWGTLRDLYATGRARPTFLGLELVNRAILGDAVAIEQSGENPSWTQSVINGIGAPTEVEQIQSFAFRSRDTTSLILFNLDDVAHDVAIGIGRTPTPSVVRYKIVPQDFHADNEESEEVRIESDTLNDFHDGYAMTLPPRSMYAMVWKSLPDLQDVSEDGGPAVPFLEVVGASSDDISLRYATSGGRVRIDLIDMTGAFVRRVIDRLEEGGEHVAAVETLGLPTGLYFCRMSTESGGVVRRVVVVK